jgi:hypothetical protein
MYCVTESNPRTEYRPQRNRKGSHGDWRRI